MNFFTLKRNNEKLKIIHKKDDLNIDMSSVNKCNNYETLLKNTILDDDINFIYLKGTLKNSFQINNTPYYYILLDFNINEAYSITSIISNNNFKVKKSMSLFNKRININNLKKEKIKYKYIISNYILPDNYNKIKNMNYISREKFLFNHRLRIFKNLFSILEDNGTFFLSLLYFNGDETINLIYILAYMFESITIFNCQYIVCYNFLGKKSLIKKNDIKELILNNNFSITPKFNINELIKYINDTFERKLKLYELVYNNKKDELFKYYLFLLYNDLSYNERIVNKINIQMEINKILNNPDYYKQLKDESIDDIKYFGLRSIPNEHGTYIRKIVKKNNYNKCIELGMGYGGYTYYILKSNSPNHVDLISIDPNQNKLYNNIGIKTIKKYDLFKYHKLIEKDTIIALSEIIIENGKHSIDLIFINEINNYENILYDITLCDFLLDINGVILLLITDKNKIKLSINYLKLTKKYKIIYSDKKLIVFHKILL